MGVLFSRAALLAIFTAALPAADPSIEEILLRLDRLEKENKALREEVRELRSRFDAGNAPMEERLAVQERRVEEQQQTKVESGARVPVRLTGMLLFNLYSSSSGGVPAGYPTVAINARTPSQLQGTMRQTTIGLQVESPVSILGAQAHGNVMMDFYGFYDEYPAPRIRTAALDLDWSARSVRVGIEKAIVAPRNPTSLAQQIYPALWGAGNLWLWQPQVTLEQRFRVAGIDVTAQGGVFQTNESRVGQIDALSVQPRPGWQGRVQLARRIDENRTFEFAPGFHYSRTHYMGGSAPSQLLTADWLLAPSRWWELSGALFHGRNAAPLGGLRQGVVVLGPGRIRAVGTTGGWAQWMLKPADRLRFHFMAGQQDDRNRDLRFGGIGRNLSWAANAIVQLSPNVLAGIEAQQIRTTHLGLGTRVVNRYDLALGYLF